MPDILTIQSEFPILDHFKARGIKYLDSAATTQKPRSVLEAEQHFYTRINAGTRRGISSLSHDATISLENARGTIASFINATDASSIVLTKNATEALNLVAFGFAKGILLEGDIILVSELEHHANLIPWQMIAKETGATLELIPVNDVGEIDMAGYRELLTDRVKIVAIAHVSNVFGTTLPVKEIIKLAHAKGAFAVIDGTQAAAHQPLDMHDLDADFYAFSGHKMYGPLGVGVLYGKLQLLDMTAPLLYGGSMIEHVTYQEATFDKPPYRFEGGTGNGAAAVGLQEAIGFIEQLGWADIMHHEHEIMNVLHEGLRRIEGIIIYRAPKDSNGSVISFNLEGIHPHDVGQVLDITGVMVRVGHHCAEPLMAKLGVAGTVRLSIGVYSTQSDIEVALQAIRSVRSKVGYGQS